MKIYVSLPKETEPYFRTLYPSERYITGHDPEGQKVGSGGALRYLLEDHPAGERCIVINAGGESRRLPAYAAYGKVLLPMPVMKWSRGQRLTQRLLELQEDYLTQLATKAPSRTTALVASGDVLLSLPTDLPPMPDADVVLVGLWSDTETMTRHGVFLCDPDDPERLVGMVQKPTSAELEELGKQHLLMIDSGVWLLSDRALDRLRSMEGYVDLYTDFARNLAGLDVAVYPISEAGFHHFGSTADLVESTRRMQNRSLDQRNLLSTRWKRHGSIVALNARIDRPFDDQQHHIWVENSHLPGGLRLTNHNVVTGLPVNDLHLTLEPGVCLDIVPVRQGGYGVRVYRYEDTFKGGSYMGRELDEDPYTAALFPHIDQVEELPGVLDRLLKGEEPQGRCYSAAELITVADWERVEQQRTSFLKENMLRMQENHGQSVFYHSDLSVAAGLMTDLPEPLPAAAPLVVRLNDAAFRYAITGQERYAAAADDCLGELLSPANAGAPTPYRAVYPDQIIWARAPMRIDVAGGWSDTPPYCIYEGGAVVNFALTLNGQEPLQVYIRPNPSGQIVLRSIDMGLQETITAPDQLLDYRRLGSPFAIPKAALCLCGVCRRGESLGMLLDRIGGGLELTLLSAVPAGSGLGTSSILGATVLGALSEYFGLGWTKDELAARTLLLEQMLTSGGGWQDQWGGIFGGVKLITTGRGVQEPRVQWLPDTVFRDPECHILYYTGLTRHAKSILGGIVRRMMLNEHDTLTRLRQIKQLGHAMAATVGSGDIGAYGRLLTESWQANKRLDEGATTPEIEAIISRIKDYALGYKLPGAGGGGFLYIVAKDPEVARRICTLLSPNYNFNSTARLVDMRLSDDGLIITRS